MTASLRPADARFLLPQPPLSLRVVGRAPGWAEAVRRAGLDLPGPTPSAIVGDRSAVAAALGASAGNAAIVVGGGRPRGIEPSWSWTRVLMRPGPVGPRLLVPAGTPVVARYAFGLWAQPPEAWRRIRGRVVATALSHGVVPTGSRLTIGARSSGPPYLAAAARDLGIPAEPRWFCSLGDGDDFQRGVFHLFSPDDTAPRWVVKFSRTAGDDRPFVAEARARALLESRAPIAARRAPQILGRCDVDVPAAAETAAAGPPLSVVLDGRGHRAAKLATIDDIVAWIAALGTESRGRVEEIAPERERLASVVVKWSGAGCPPDLVDRLPVLAPVLAHHDLGSWNAVVTQDGVMVLDWESARYPAMPLWDLLYFLTDALVALDGPAPVATKVARALALLRGELPQSATLFSRLRDAAARFDVPTGALGPLATLAWLHHGLSPAARSGRAEAATGATTQAVGEGLLTRLARPWLVDPALGPDWPAFNR